MSVCLSFFFTWTPNPASCPPSPPSFLSPLLNSDCFCLSCLSPRSTNWCDTDSSCLFCMSVCLSLILLEPQPHPSLPLKPPPSLLPPLLSSDCFRLSCLSPFSTNWCDTDSSFFFFCLSVCLSLILLRLQPRLLTPSLLPPLLSSGCFRHSGLSPLSTNWCDTDSSFFCFFCFCMSVCLPLVLLGPPTPPLCLLTPPPPPSSHPSTALAVFASLVSHL